MFTERGATDLRSGTCALYVRPCTARSCRKRSPTRVFTNRKAPRDECKAVDVARSSGSAGWHEVLWKHIGGMDTTSKKINAVSKRSLGRRTGTASKQRTRCRLRGAMSSRSAERRLGYRWGVENENLVSVRSRSGRSSFPTGQRDSRSRGEPTLEDHRTTPVLTERGAPALRLAAGAPGPASGHSTPGQQEATGRKGKK